MSLLSDCCKRLPFCLALLAWHSMVPGLLLLPLSLLFVILILSGNSEALILI